MRILLTDLCWSQKGDDRKWASLESEVVTEKEERKLLLCRAASLEIIPEGSPVTVNGKSGEWAPRARTYNDLLVNATGIVVVNLKSLADKQNKGKRG